MTQKRGLFQKEIGNVLGTTDREKCQHHAEINNHYYFDGHWGAFGAKMERRGLFRLFCCHLLVFSMPGSKVIIIVIQFLFLGINMFCGLVRVILTLA